MASFFQNIFPFLDPNNLPAFFNDEEAAVRAATEASLREQQQPPRGPPPASPRHVRSLPVIRISSEDLVDPVNRECCICLEPHPLHTQALRLPCAHIFHATCIQNWLQSHCTCPVCRFELPTEDPMYEAGRVQRMKERKPRFARHELDRLPLKRLKALRQNASYHAVDRQDLVDHLIKSGAIELISTPEPVEYSIKVLRNMSVSQLRRCMNDEAGVFFDPKDVIEKEDMIRIFLLSGRLDVIPEPDEEENDGEDDDEEEEDTKPVAISKPDEEKKDGEQKENYTLPVATSGHSQHQDDKPSAVPRAPIVETVTNEEILETDERTNRDLVMEESGHGRDGVMPENDTTAAAATTGSMPVDSIQDDQSPETDMQETDSTMAAAATTTETQGVTLPSDPMISDSLDDSAVAVESRGETSVQADSSTAATSPSLSTDDALRRGRKRPLLSTPVRSTSDGESILSRFDSLSVSELRDMGRTMSIDLSDCIERDEMIRRLSSGDSDVQTASNHARMGAESTNMSLFQEWSVSDIRTGARLVKIDLGECQATTRQDMIRSLCRGLDERPHAGQFLQALVPFMGLSVSQLKAAAREMRVNLSQCIEKDDMLLRIVESQIERA